MLMILVIIICLVVLLYKNHLTFTYAKNQLKYWINKLLKYINIQI